MASQKELACSPFRFNGSANGDITRAFVAAIENQFDLITVKDPNQKLIFDKTLIMENSMVLN